MKEMFNRWAPYYDRDENLYFTREGDLHRTVALKAIASLKNMSSPRIIDVGCGTGQLLRLLIEQKIQANYLGIDISPFMLAETERVAVPGAGDVQLLEASIMDLSSVEKASSSWTVASHVLHFLDPLLQKQALKQLDLITAENGLLLLTISNHLEASPAKDKEIRIREGVELAYKYVDVEEITKFLLQKGYRLEYQDSTAEYPGWNLHFLLFSKNV